MTYDDPDGPQPPQHLVFLFDTQVQCGCGRCRIEPTAIQRPRVLADGTVIEDDVSD